LLIMDYYYGFDLIVIFSIRNPKFHDSSIPDTLSTEKVYMK